MMCVLLQSLLVQYVLNPYRQCNVGNWLIMYWHVKIDSGLYVQVEINFCRLITAQTSFEIDALRWGEIHCSSFHDRQYIGMNSCHKPESSEWAISGSLSILSNEVQAFATAQLCKMWLLSHASTSHTFQFGSLFQSHNRRETFFLDRLFLSTNNEGEVAFGEYCHGGVFHSACGRLGRYLVG